MKRSRVLRLSMFGFLLLGAVGCGGGGADAPQPVSGKVTFPDGKPLTKGRVNFDSGKHSAFGLIGSDGTYTLTSIEEGDGVPVGTYKVYIAGAQEGGGDPHAAENIGKKVEPPTPLIASEYESAETTPLTKEVTSGSNTIDLEVKPAG